MTNLMTCPACDQPMAETSEACPHCGAMIPQRYTTPDYARPPRSRQERQPYPRPTPEEEAALVADMMQQLDALRAINRQEFVNLVAWRAHALALREKHAKVARGQSDRPAVTTSAGPAQRANVAKIQSEPGWLLAVTVLLLIGTLIAAIQLWRDFHSWPLTAIAISCLYLWTILLRRQKR